MADCWAAEAMQRPPMRQVAARLADFLASAELEVRQVWQGSRLV